MRLYAATKPKQVSIKLRVARADLNIIDIAAEMQRTDRTSFILNAACRRAEQVILDGHSFLIESSEFDAFEAALDGNFSKGNGCLANLLQRPNRWG